MNHLSKIVIVAAVSCMGELLNFLLPLPIPGSIYGLVIMFLLLFTGTVQLSQVHDIGNWLLTLMPIMFVGPTVGLLVTWDSFKTFLIPILITCTVSTALVMAVTGRVAQALIVLEDRRRSAHAAPVPLRRIGFADQLRILGRRVYLSLPDGRFWYYRNRGIKYGK